MAWRGYRIYLQKLKVPEEVSSRPKERKGEINGKMAQEKLSFAKRHAKKKKNMALVSKDRLRCSILYN